MNDPMYFERLSEIAKEAVTICRDEAKLPDGKHHYLSSLNQDKEFAAIIDNDGRFEVYYSDNEYWSVRIGLSLQSRLALSADVGNGTLTLNGNPAEWTVDNMKLMHEYARKFVDEQLKPNTDPLSKIARVHRKHEIDRLKKKLEELGG